MGNDTKPGDLVYRWNERQWYEVTETGARALQTQLPAPKDASATIIRAEQRFK